MRLSEWLEQDDIAISYGAQVYGLPRNGHSRCFQGIISRHAPEHVKDSPDIRTKRCIECNQPLLPPARERRET